MSNVGPFFSWKCHVIRLMRDQGLPLRLTTKEIDRMESMWHYGCSPEDFIETLNYLKQVG